MVVNMYACRWQCHCAQGQKCTSSERSTTADDCHTPHHACTTMRWQHSSLPSASKRLKTSVIVAISAGEKPSFEHNCDTHTHTHTCRARNTMVWVYLGGALSRCRLACSSMAGPTFDAPDFGLGACGGSALEGASQRCGPAGPRSGPGVVHNFLAEHARSWLGFRPESVLPARIL